jgi:chromosome segregation ATPase
MGEDLFAPGPSSSLAMRNTPNRNSLGPDIFSPSRNANIKQALSPSSADTATAAFRTQSSFPSHSQDTDSDDDDVPADIHPELRRLREELDGARRSKQKYKQKFKEERDEKESIQKEYDEIRKEYNEILHQHNVVSLERDEWKDRYADVRKEVLEEVIRDLLRKRDLPVESQFGDLE